LVPLQEKMSSRPTEVEEFPIETLIDLPAESTMELASIFTAMETSLSLRLPDVHDLLQIFLQETVSQKIGMC